MNLWISEPIVAYTDILATSVSDQGPDHFMFAMELAGPIPQTPTHHIWYVWEFDLDENGTFNETTDRNVRVAFDPNFGWQGHVDGPELSPVSSSFEITDHTVGLVLPSALLGASQSFNWQVAIPVPGAVSDGAPNTGFATWPPPSPTPANSCQEELELQVSLDEGGTAERALVTSYQCMAMYVDSRGQQPSISS